MTIKRRELTVSGKLCLEALRRFPGYSVNSITHYLERRYPDIFTNFSSTRANVQRLAGIKDLSGYTRIKERYPSLPPVAMPPTMRKIRVDYDLPFGKYGIMADLHLPYHEPLPIKRAMDWFRYEKITGLILLGDFMDCAAVSFWMPTKRRDFMHEVEQACDFLDLLKKSFPRCKIIVMQGNHEERLANYFNMHAPELVDMPGADMATIISANERGLDVLERKQKIVAAEMTLIHGHEIRGGSTVVSPARWAMLRGKACCAVGHWHCTIEATENDLNRKMVTCWSIGCLCDLEPDYSPVGNRWNWGCAMLNYKQDTWEFQNKRILNNGKMV